MSEDNIENGKESEEKDASLAVESEDSAKEAEEVVSAEVPTEEVPDVETAAEPIAAEPTAAEPIAFEEEDGDEEDEEISACIGSLHMREIGLRIG